MQINKKEILEVKLGKIQKEFKNKDIRKFYKGMKNELKGYQPRTLFIEYGNLIDDPEDRTITCQNFF